MQEYPTEKNKFTDQRKTMRETQSASIGISAQLLKKCPSLHPLRQEKNDQFRCTKAGRTEE